MFRKSCRLAFALLVLTSLEASSYSPVQDWSQCPVPLNDAGARFSPLPVFELTQLYSPIDSWPEPGTYDFCACIDTFYCQLKALDAFGVDTESFAHLIRCTDGDINGFPGGQFTATTPVSIAVDSAGNCTIYWNGTLTHSAVNIPGWNPQPDWYMGMGARTGFFDDFQLVDNFSLTGTSSSYTEDFSNGPGLGTLYGDAIIYNQGLRLTRAISSQLGTWSFLPEDPQNSFTITFDQFMGGGSSADGMAFVYGPGANTAFGEAGPDDPAGLRVTFYTYGELQNTIRLAYNGTTILDVEAGPLHQNLSLINGNGMLDGQYELAILASILNDPSHPLYEETLGVFQQNFVEIKNLIQDKLYAAGYLGLIPIVAPHLIGSMAMLFAGYLVEGDEDTRAAVEELLAAVDIRPLPGDFWSMTSSVPQTGPVGDIDNDGFSNRDEYGYYVGDLGYDPGQFNDYVMNTRLTIQGAGNYSIGSEIALKALLAFGTPDSYYWEKDKESLGVATDSLSLLNAQLSDSGLYEVTVSHSIGQKTSAEMQTGIQVTVRDSNVPVAGFITLTGLACAVALLGVRRLGGPKK